MSEEIRRFCPECNRHVLARRPGVNHLVHGLATLFLCGFWLPIWFLAILFCQGEWRCTHCGTVLGQGQTTPRAGAVVAILVGILLVVLLNAVANYATRPTNLGPLPPREPASPPPPPLFVATPSPSAPVVALPTPPASDPAGTGLVLPSRQAAPAAAPPISIADIEAERHKEQAAILQQEQDRQAREQAQRDRQAHEQAQDAEVEAAKRLQSAKLFAAGIKEQEAAGNAVGVLNMKAGAVKRLQAIIDEYPSTQAGQEAKQLLKNLAP